MAHFPGCSHPMTELVKLSGWDMTLSDPFLRLWLVTHTQYHFRLVVSQNVGPQSYNLFYKSN